MTQTCTVQLLLQPEEDVGTDWATDEARAVQGEVLPTEFIPWPELSKPLTECSSRELGTEGERMAANYLAKNGYEIVERNWRCPCGEVDIVAREDDTYVLVEVKTRLALGANSCCMPELAVNSRKRAKYRKLALVYLANHLEVNAVRFDVMALNVVSDRCARARHLICAYGWDD